MIGFLSKMFGGSKSEKDVKAILPLVSRINQNFQTYQSLTNDELRGKTVEFRQRIQDHLKEINELIADTNKKAEEEIEEEEEEQDEEQEGDDGADNQEDEADENSRSTT